MPQPEAGDLVGRSDQAIGYWRSKGKIADDEWYQDESGYYFVLQSAVERVAETMDRRQPRLRGTKSRRSPPSAPVEATVDGLEAIDLKELSKQLGAVMRERDHLEAENARLRRLGTDLSAAIQRYLAN